MQHIQNFMFPQHQSVHFKERQVYRMWTNFKNTPPLTTTITTTTHWCKKWNFCFCFIIRLIVSSLLTRSSDKLTVYNIEVHHLIQNKKIGTKYPIKCLPFRPTSDVRVKHINLSNMPRYINDDKIFLIKGDTTAQVIYSLWSIFCKQVEKYTAFNNFWWKSRVSHRYLISCCAYNLWQGNTSYEDL